MGDAADITFEKAESGASLTYPKQCSALRKNEYCLIKKRPVKIVEMTTSKTGKHGHAKVHLTGIDIFNGKKYEDICPSTHNIDVPHVKRLDYQLADIQDDDYVSLMDDSGVTRDDLKLPDGDLGENIRKAFDNGDSLVVSVISAMGEENIHAFKKMVD
ncbi:hypothetical protein LOTGIDRAFT_236304 [Lottia gigantea]|uniref:Eukaryotic translation initiation factor 5A n=1 Tax=Lottia gigantea TaxID=225164 RepID=V3Z1E5_LOTGI|nr:hypothetical protein LOTGIDRAFT_236304 [Lottia gigantea]ESO84338.1 hypothetical protein LOTGIDRAFT_236304 [Lottia gigantea]